ncbi:hypothetical protein VNO78_17966 [Psophocarpus tetragonolobus]|uniref:Uncharacterized protein n=1 Tax=Psophocarpus tetragonolobus TaxID=3891 RepID=A0AAN9XL16_PSOTE
MGRNHKSRARQQPTRKRSRCGPKKSSGFPKLKENQQNLQLTPKKNNNCPVERRGAIQQLNEKITRGEVEKSQDMEVDFNRNPKKLVKGKMAEAGNQPCQKLVKGKIWRWKKAKEGSREGRWKKVKIWR